MPFGGGDLGGDAARPRPATSDLPLPPPSNINHCITRRCAHVLYVFSYVRFVGAVLFTGNSHEAPASHNYQSEVVTLCQFIFLFYLLSYTVAEVRPYIHVRTSVLVA